MADDPPPPGRIWTELDHIREDIERLRRDNRDELAAARKEIAQKDLEIKDLKDVQLKALSDRIGALEFVNKMQSKLSGFGKWLIATGIAVAGLFMGYWAIKK